MAAAPPPHLPDRAPAPYDPERLQALTVACEGYEREMVLELLLRLPWLMQEVTRGVVLRDATHLANHARELRRSCDTLGASALAEACAALEHMGERGEFRDARPRLDRAHHEHARLQQALAQHLADLRRS